jgi:hypothetical protein
MSSSLWRARDFRGLTVVYRLTYNGDVVAFQMGRRSAAAGREESAYLNRSLTDPAAAAARFNLRSRDQDGCWG